VARVRLAHLTDLHCDGSDAWKTQFAYVQSCLSDLKPDIVVITGDCVDHPKTSLFNTLAESLRNLCKTLASGRSEAFYLITVPGNHDRFFLETNSHFS
jgi:3',5'-cyclic AMP phosphodiesterase CpdA